jgi:hypothetical protein
MGRETHQDDFVSLLQHVRQGATSRCDDGEASGGTGYDLEGSGLVWGQGHLG